MAPKTTLRGRAMTLRGRLADIARFVVRPGFAARPMARRPGFVGAWAVLVALTLLAVGLARVLIEAVLGPSGVLPESAIEGPPAPREVLEYLLLAPLLEETLCRGWMSGRRAALRFGAYGLIALGLMVTGLAAAPPLRGTLALAAVVVVFAGLIHWGLTRHRPHDRTVPESFVRQFRWWVWGSSLGFALLHLGRYDALTHPLGVVVVAPLMLGGMLLAYTRTRLGLRAAMAHHAAYNAVLVALALAAA